jgi:hypothetical protein
MKNINKKTVFISTVVFVLLLIPSLLAAFGEDEGTLGANIIWLTFAKLFYVLRFPTHTLIWSLITKGGATIFFVGLIINCLFYGLIIERLIYYIKRLRK